MEAVQGLGVVALLTLAGAAVWLGWRGRLGVALGGPRSKGPAELVQRLPLTAQHSLHLIRAGSETLWVVTFPNGAVLERSRAFPEWLDQSAAELHKEGR